MSSSPLASLITGPTATVATATGMPADGNATSGEFANVLAAVETAITAAATTATPTVPAAATLIAPATPVEGELASLTAITSQALETLSTVDTDILVASEEASQPASILAVPAKITESLKTLKESITTTIDAGSEKAALATQPTSEKENSTLTEDVANGIAEDKASENLTVVSPQILPETQNSTKATFLTENSLSDVSSSLEPAIYAGSAEETKIEENTSKATIPVKADVPTLDITVKNLNNATPDAPNLAVASKTPEASLVPKTETKDVTETSSTLESVTQYGFAPIAPEQENAGQPNSNSSSQGFNQAVQATQAAPTEGSSLPSTPVTTPQTATNTPVSLPQTVQAHRDTPLVQQIGKPVLELAKAPQGEHTLIIKINPDNLGQVTVQASISENNVRIELIASNDAGRDALKNMMGDLRKDLAQTGLNTSLNLSDQRSQERNQAATDFMNQKENSRNSSDMETRDEHSAKPLAEASTSREYRSSLNSDTLLDVLA